jgi:hypothetical protein
MFRETISCQEREGAAAHPIHGDSEVERGITGDTAIPLETFFKTSEFWINLQMSGDTAESDPSHLPALFAMTTRDTQK